MLDYVIIGQGIAGSALALELLFRNKNICVIDAGIENSSSSLAAGIVNPVTGRRLVKSWKIDELLPYSREFYQQAEELLQKRFLRDRKIMRVFIDNRERNDFQTKSAVPGLAKYLDDNIENIPSAIKEEHSGGWIEKAMQVDTSAYLPALRKHLKNNDLLIEEKFDHNALIINKDDFQYKSLKSRQIVFCEGKELLNNPFFSEIPFTPAKGEFLIIDVPDLDIDFMIKKSLMLVPTDIKNRYWVGATFNHHYQNEKPSEKAKDQLLEKLAKVLDCPFKLIDHNCGVRPVSKDRRPIIGSHSVHKNMYLFNGMGSKGISLSPYFAKNFIDALEADDELLADVDLNRFSQ